MEGKDRKSISDAGKAMQGCACGDATCDCGEEKPHTSGWQTGS